MRPSSPLLALCALPLVACQAGGSIAGPADTHCAGVTPPTVGTCEAASTPTVSLPNQAVYYGSAAQDDDCKYHLSWSLGDPTANVETSIELTVTDSGGNPVTGAGPTVTTTAGASHGGLQAAATATETQPGSYLITPIRFDQTGRWVVRFDLFPACADVVDSSGNASPRAHAAFYYEIG